MISCQHIQKHFSDFPTTSDDITTNRNFRSQIYRIQRLETGEHSTWWERSCKNQRSGVGVWLQVWRRFSTEIIHLIFAFFLPAKRSRMQVLEHMVTCHQKSFVKAWATTAAPTGLALAVWFTSCWRVTALSDSTRRKINMKLIVWRSPWKSNCLTHTGW